MIADYYQLFLLTIIVTLFSFLLKKKPIMLHGVQWIIIIFAINFLIVNMSTELDIDHGYLLSYLLYICLFFVMTMQDYTIKDIKNLITCYIISALILSLMVLIIQHPYGLIENNRYSIKFGNNEAIDPNFLSAYLVIPVLFALKRWLFSNNQRYRIIYSLITICCMLAVLFTGSRAATIGLLIGSVGIVYHYHFIYKNITRKTILKIFFAFILLIIIGLLIKEILPSAIYNRLFNNSYNDGSNELRFSHWVAAIECIKQSPLMGYGAIETKYILLNVANHYGDVHNAIFSLWLQTGLFGLMCIIVLHIWIWKNLKRCMALKSIFMCHIFTSLIISSQLTIGYWTLLILLVIIIKVHKKNDINLFQLI